MKIVVTDGRALHGGDVPWSPLEALGKVEVHDETAPDQLPQRAEGASVLVINKTPIDAVMFERLPSLKLIAVTATGFNVIDIDAAAKRGVVVCNVPEYSTQVVAQFTFALMLELAHHVGLHDASVHEGQWTNGPWCYWLKPGTELEGKTLGLIGFGRIGQAVAKLAGAFGMQVIAHNRSRRQTELATMVSLHDVFEQADVVSLHCPQTPENAGFVNADLLSRMKPSAWLINTARGGLINEADLAVALNEGWIAGAAVDVASREPIAGDNPLLGAKNLIITPHIAWTAVETRKRLLQMTADNIAAWMKGEPVNVVSRG